MEDDIVAAGAEIIWVLERDNRNQPGTVDLCTSTMDTLGSEDQGWCVGDEQTLPQSGAFDDSPLSIARGFDIIVSRESMEILWESNHGTPIGNDNLDGEQVLAAVREAVANL
ncbi:MAG: hypothetical protein KTR31_17350 [Myxococcales bacterium]|nr:hypothetical protein [Myxococcales bacterium]